VKNIQFIDSATNCVYDIFSATDREFALIFPDGTDIAFIEEVYAKGDDAALDRAFGNISKRPIRKRNTKGIHGILFYGLNEKMVYYPTRRDEEAVNPGGSRLRAIAAKPPTKASLRARKAFAAPVPSVVYLLQHVARQGTDDEDVKDLGIYSSKAEAEAVVERFRKLPGFRRYRRGFSIDFYLTNEDNWASGFVTR
jgi:hypothetical protein